MKPGTRVEQGAKLKLFSEAAGKRERNKTRGRRGGRNKGVRACRPPGTLRRQRQRRACPRRPRPGRARPPQHPGVSPAPSRTPRLSPRRFPPQGLGLPRGRASRGLRYSPAPLCFPSGPHGQEPPAASARWPQGLGRCGCPRSGPGPAGRGRPGRFSRSERRGPSGTDRGRRDINNTSGQLRMRGHAPAGLGLRRAAPLPYHPPQPRSGRNHSVPGVGAPRQGGHSGG